MTITTHVKRDSSERNNSHARCRATTSLLMNDTYKWLNKNSKTYEHKVGYQKHRLRKQERSTLFILRLNALMALKSTSAGKPFHTFILVSYYRRRCCVFQQPTGTAGIGRLIGNGCLPAQITSSAWIVLKTNDSTETKCEHTTTTIIIRLSVNTSQVV